MSMVLSPNNFPMVVVGNHWGNHFKPTFKLYSNLYRKRGLSQCHNTIHMHICLAASIQKDRFLMGTSCLYFEECKTNKQKTPLGNRVEAWNIQGLTAIMIGDYPSQSEAKWALTFSQITLIDGGRKWEEAQWKQEAHICGWISWNTFSRSNNKRW